MVNRFRYQQCNPQPGGGKRIGKKEHNNFVFFLPMEPKRPRREKSTRKGRGPHWFPDAPEAQDCELQIFLVHLHLSLPLWAFAFPSLQIENRFLFAFFTSGLCLEDRDASFGEEEGS